MLASVRLLLLRLNERKHQHDYNQLLKHINVVYIYNITASFYCCVIYMWQSRVEIELYSVAYFERIAAFEALNAVFPLQAGLIRAL